MAKQSNMVIALEGRKRWAFITLIGVPLIAYVFIAAKEFVAFSYAGRGDLNSLQRASRFSPGDARYRFLLGRYERFEALDSEAAATEYESSIRLNPHDARSWLELAATYHVLGNVELEKSALEQARRADPVSPVVAWEAANFDLASGNVSTALHEYRVVIEYQPELAGLAFQAAWRAVPDVDVLLAEAVPNRAEPLLNFLSFLIYRKETEATLKVWNRIVQTHEPFPSRKLFEYVHFLVEARRPDAAAIAWEQASNALGLASYLPTSDNLIVNGDFSLEILNGGFDWTYVERDGVQLWLDTSTFHQGNRSLSISFEGVGVSDAGIRQLVPVRASTAYEFSAYYKCAGLQGAGGPQVVLRDAYTGTTLFASEPLMDADFWKLVHAKISTRAETNLVQLTVERVPLGSPIRGKLWLDNFALTPAPAKDAL